MIDLDRRTLLATTLAASATALPSIAQAQALTFIPQPLPFDPATIPGLSSKLLSSHHDNNYIGAVKRLNAIAGDLAKLDVATAPNYVLNGLKREELIAWNSMVLHEIYFSGLGRPKAPEGSLGRAIEKDFGSYARWATEFAAVGKALGGGSGWVLLTWDARNRRLMNQWAADHTMTLAGGTPLLALDMYEHAYALDYGAKAGVYVDTYMAAIDWSNASKRFAAIAGRI